MIGPFTMNIGHGLDVLARWFMWKSGSMTPSRAETMTGMYSRPAPGRHRAGGDVLGGDAPVADL